MLNGDKKSIQKLFSVMDFHNKVSAPYAMGMYGLKIYSRFWSRDVPLFNSFEKLYGNIFSRFFEYSIILNRKIVWCMAFIVDCIFTGLYKRRFSYYMSVLFAGHFNLNVDNWNRMIEEGETFEDI